MAVETNGKALEPAISMTKPKSGGRTPRQPTKSQRSISQKALNMAAWLFTWFGIVTILFRCPSTTTNLSETSPRLCKPYLNVKATITPHLQPYYTSYAAPYVDTTRPYVEAVNKTVLAPTLKFGKENYQAYGAPRVEQAWHFGLDEWEKSLKPQVLSMVGQGKRQYELALAPYVGKVTDATSPYYGIARENIFRTYHGYIMPAYMTSKPYAEHGYGIAHRFAVETGIPYARLAWNTIAIFIERTLWPQVRVLYGENVEPQLVRIGERLGRYRDGRRLKAAVNEVESSTVLSSVVSSVAGGTASLETTTSSLTPAQQEEVARKEIEADLKTWHEKFQKAIVTGKDDLNKRISEVTRRQNEGQVLGVGKALYVQLDELSSTEFANLKGKILKIVGRLDDSTTENDELSANEDLIKAVRATGMSIKDKAQALRSWRQNLIDETQSLVSAATDSTLEIVDNIRDLGLQEIGMKWAWMEGVTYKDWSKYNSLKKSFDELRHDIEKLATDHPALLQMEESSEDIENAGMTVAEEAAKELGRLKEVGKWKIQAKDKSDDFSTKYIPAAAVQARKHVVKKASEAGEAIMGTQQGSFDSILSQATASAADAASLISSGVIGTEQPLAESVISAASESIYGASAKVLGTEPNVVEKVATKISEVVSGTKQPLSERIRSAGKSRVAGAASQMSAGIDAEKSAAQDVLLDVSSQASEAGSSVSSGAQSIVSAASKKAEKGASSASEAIKGTPAPASDSFASDASSNVASIASVISEAISGADTSMPVQKSASSVASSMSSSISSVGSKASKRVVGGASAQRVEARSIVYEDNISDDGEAAFSQKIQSMASQAGDKFSDITMAVSEALLRPTTTKGSAGSISSLASDRYYSAVSAASIALYGTPQGTAESIASVASGKYADAVAAASSAIYGTPAPLTASLAAQASSKYSEAASRAQEQYSHAMSIVSVQASGKPKPVHQQMLSSVESAYSGSVAEASRRYQAALEAASSGIYGTAPSPQESIISVAKAKYAQITDHASAQYESARTAISGSKKSERKSLLSAAGSSYSDLLNAASIQYASATAAASTAYYGAPPSAQKSLLSAAHARYSQATDFAAGQLESARTAISGSKKPKRESLLSAAESSYSDLLSAANNQYTSATAAASNAFYGPPPGAIESISNVASSRLNDGLQIASARYASAKEAMKTQPTPAHQRYLADAQRQYYEGIGVAHDRYSEFVSAASSAVYGTPTPAHQYMYGVASEALYGSSTGSIESIASEISKKAESAASVVSSSVIGSETPWTESVASVASQNWEDLVSKASEQVYGAPTPFSESVISQAGVYAAQATDGAAQQYEAVRALVSELVIGKEPDFTESVMSQFSSVWYKNGPEMASSASSYASDAYASASSVVSSVFTPPATLEAILGAANEQINAAVEAASIQYYGTTKGTYEKATSAAGSAYSSAQSKASEAVYGSPIGYAEAAQSSISEAAASAQSAASAAIYGTSTGYIESATSAAADAYASASSVAAENAASISSAASSAVYGPEQGALESVQSRLSVAIESARVKLAEFGQSAGEDIEKMASSVSSAAASATSKIKDEL